MGTGGISPEAIVAEFTVSRVVCVTTLCFYGYKVTNQIERLKILEEKRKAISLFPCKSKTLVYIITCFSP